MRPYIPVEVLVRETPELQKSVAADLQVPDPVIVAPSKPKSTKKGKEVEDSPEYDAGTGSNDNNASVSPTSK